MDVYAWKSTTNKPYQNQIGDADGACICGNENERYMVLEIPASEFDFSSMHRYSVIPHEYFLLKHHNPLQHFHEEIL